MIAEKENALSPQSVGIKPPKVDPTNTPIHINVFADIAQSILYICLVIQCAHVDVYTG